MPPTDANSPEGQGFYEPDIHYAARRGDIATLECLITEGADINARYFNNRTPLMVAASTLDGATVDTLRFLVKHGADLHATCGWGQTAAYYAAGTGIYRRGIYDRSRIVPDHAERLRFLLDCGLDPHERVGNAGTLLAEAATAGDPARVKLLLDRGVSPHPVSPKVPWYPLTSREIPLFCVAEFGSVPCVQLLLDAGADPNAEDSDGLTALNYATHNEAVRDALIVAGASVEIAKSAKLKEELNEFFNSFFEEDPYPWDVSDEERQAMAQALYAAGAPPDNLPDSGWPRLYRAAYFHEADTVEFLLNYRFAADADRTPLLETYCDDALPLLAVCWNKEHDEVDALACQRIIQALIADGAPIDGWNDIDWIPLYVAVLSCNISAMRTLLALGADVNIQKNTGDTPLNLAVQRCNLEAVVLLLNAGADITLTDEFGRTPLDKAKGSIEYYERYERNGPPETASYNEKRLKRFYAIYDALLSAQNSQPSNAHESPARNR